MKNAELEKLQTQSILKSMSWVDYCSWVWVWDTQGLEESLKHRTEETIAGCSVSANFDYKFARNVNHEPSDAFWASALTARVGLWDYCTLRYCALWRGSYGTSYTRNNWKFSPYDPWGLTAHKEGDYEMNYGQTLDLVRILLWMENYRTYEERTRKLSKDKEETTWQLSTKR